MMKPLKIVVPALFIAVVFACSHTSPVAIYSATDCPSQGVTSEECATCLLSSCASEVAAINSGCSAGEVNCSCAPGGSPANCGLSLDCQAVGPVYQSCLETTCATACSASGSGSGSGITISTSSGGDDSSPDAGSDDAGSEGVDAGEDASGSCFATAGEECTATSDCCADNGDTTQCAGLIGIGTVCTASCVADSDCGSGCCGSLQDGLTVCVASVFCTNTSACTVTDASGGSCSADSDCCPDTANGNPTACSCDDGADCTCHALCTQGSDCTSNCCAERSDGLRICVAVGSGTCV